MAGTPKCSPKAAPTLRSDKRPHNGGAAVITAMRTPPDRHVWHFKLGL